jgi:hypothetical protein
VEVVHGLFRCFQEVPPVSPIILAVLRNISRSKPTPAIMFCELVISLWGKEHDWVMIQDPDAVLCPAGYLLSPDDELRKATVQYYLALFDLYLPKSIFEKGASRADRRYKMIELFGIIFEQVRQDEDLSDYVVHLFARACMWVEGESPKGDLSHALIIKTITESKLGKELNDVTPLLRVSKAAMGAFQELSKVVVEVARRDLFRFVAILHGTKWSPMAQVVVDIMLKSDMRKELVDTYQCLLRRSDKFLQKDYKFRFLKAFREVKLIGDEKYEYNTKILMCVLLSLAGQIGIRTKDFDNEFLRKLLGEMTHPGGVHTFSLQNWDKYDEGMCYIAKRIWYASGAQFTEFCRQLGDLIKMENPLLSEMNLGLGVVLIHLIRMTREHDGKWLRQRKEELMAVFDWVVAHLGPGCGYVLFHIMVKYVVTEKDITEFPEPVRISLFTSIVTLLHRMEQEKGGDGLTILCLFIPHFNAVVVDIEAFIDALRKLIPVVGFTPVVLDAMLTLISFGVDCRSRREESQLNNVRLVSLLAHGTLEVRDRVFEFFRRCIGVQDMGVVRKRLVQHVVADLDAVCTELVRDLSIEKVTVEWLDVLVMIASGMTRKEWRVPRFIEQVSKLCVDLSERRSHRCCAEAVQALRLV